MEMASLRLALGARLTGLSLPEPFPLSGDSNPESMDDSEPLELSPLVMGSSIGERYVQGLCVWVIAMAAPRTDLYVKEPTRLHTWTEIVLTFSWYVARAAQSSTY